MSEKNSKKGLNRRDFIKGAAVGAGAVALSGLGITAAEAAQSPQKWDKETDVVVAGAGGGGLPAALQAVKAGAKVILLEKDSLIGGNSRYSGWCDWPEFSYEEMRRYSPAGDPEWQKVMLENVHGDNKWLIDMGAQLNLTYAEPPGHSRYRPDAAWTINGVSGNSKALVEFLGNTIKAAGGEILVETPMGKLITDPEGGVVGVIASGSAGRLTIKAKRAVILATGGYAANPGMRAKYLGKFAVNFRCRGVETITGDGILAALEVDAMVNDGIGYFYGHPMPLPPAKWSAEDTNAGFSLGWAMGVGIVVNLGGLRFRDESAKKETSFPKMMNQPEAKVFIIFDQQGRERNAERFDNIVKGGAVIASAQTIEELAKKLEEWGGPEMPRLVDPNNVITTFNEYNKAVDEKKTLALKPPRRKQIVKLATPPFYAIEAVPGMTDAFGGLMVDIKARVLDRNMRPIPRLYAIGADGARFFAYDHGGNVAGLVGGRIAGQNAAAEKSWS